MGRMLTLALGSLLGIAAREAAVAALAAKLRRDLVTLNRGDYEPLLAGFSDDAVLHFNDGPHRWAGDHVGKPAIERFLGEFVDAGLQGEVLAVYAGGAPWSMTILVRFDDSATAPDGELIYANHTVLVARTRWGKIVEQWDFYEDTGRIVALEQALKERGIGPAR